ncbi:class I SAM-dependent methyltransferase [Leptospira bandrabouensis]|uniref:class I SAM-dependent methyltransferase n=1 Tax=Leptospira bandrabouensis TaxID=2484903 RepID=UPI00223D0E36|nr:class I SAM-dependent methyltransferase [Leptospira bandrabouensis]MCW7460172.1 class I SAM-dependent methyltransferase [Leptospira bandrabouensis]MCW7479311.1 class I SAM-dependent methyltransferase [Leptospira bandrabouensis]MCW7486993.1 class I SAM-dependent methyltransferase [Leptospira bandrabouensis]
MNSITAPLSIQINPASIVENYNEFARSKGFPESLHLYPNGKRFYGEWDYGQNFKNISEYKGAYSIQDLTRLEACIPNMGHLLHIFSGSIPAGPYCRLDNNFAVIGTPVLGRDVVGEATDAHLHFGKDSFDVIMADPPWSRYHSEEIYNCSLVDKAKVMRSLFQILKPGGIVIWKDFSKPLWFGTEFDYLGRICIDPSSGHDDRSFKFFKKKEKV